MLVFRKLWWLTGTFILVIVPIVQAGQDEGPLPATAGAGPAKTGPAKAGPDASAPPAFDLPADFDGPAPPVAPAVITRDDSGRATIRAVRVATPLRIDGALDEPLYSSVPPISDFIQQEPREGEPATEKTEVWLAFDNDNVYVSFRCWESEPGQMIANEMRRDGPNMWQGNDIVTFMFDTFYDRRNSVNFVTNALGARQDGQVTNERQWNGDWNTVWDVRAGRFEAAGRSKSPSPSSRCAIDPAAHRFGASTRSAPIDGRTRSHTSHACRRRVGSRRSIRARLRPPLSDSKFHPVRETSS